MHRTHSKTRTGAALVFALLALAAIPAGAEPTIRGNFHLSCASTVVDRTVLPGGDVDLVFGVAGRDSLDRRYRIVLEVSAPGAALLPDAWRFDVGGCQGRGRINYFYWIAAAIKTCPTNMTGVPSRDYFTSELSADGRTLRIDFARELEGPAAFSNTIERILGVIEFWHVASVVGPASEPGMCGGLETPICIRLVEATYEDWAGVVRSYIRLNEDYSVQGATACPAVAAAATTWGTIKGQYR